MSATAADQPRLDLENVLAALLDSEEHLRCASLRLTSRMRTVDEAEILTEINVARAAMQRAKSGLVKIHPDRA
jgi:hypothetical protein